MGGREREVTALSVIYGMGFIGALVYFVQHSLSFWGVVFGVLKAIIWPAILIYRLLEFLQM